MKVLSRISKISDSPTLRYSSHNSCKQRPQREFYEERTEVLQISQDITYSISFIAMYYLPSERISKIPSQSVPTILSDVKPSISQINTSNSKIKRKQIHLKIESVPKVETPQKGPLRATTARNLRIGVAII